MVYEFDADTAVADLGGGAWGATLTDRWSVGNRPNGGYVMAVALRALAATLPHPDPLTVTTHFLRSPAAGDVTVRTELVRAGRSVATGQASLVQDGREQARMIAAFGNLTAANGPTSVVGKPPGLPELDDCIGRDRSAPAVVQASIADRFDIRFAPDSLGWLRGAPSGRGEIAGWVRFADGREPDLLALVQILDAFPPAVFDLGHVDSVPTIELTAHLRAHPAPGWLRVVTRTRALIDGHLEEEAEIWDSHDRLVAQSRQFARLSGPPVA